MKWNPDEAENHTMLSILNFLNQDFGIHKRFTVTNEINRIKDVTLLQGKNKLIMISLSPIFQTLASPSGVFRVIR